MTHRQKPARLPLIAASALAAALCVLPAAGASAAETGAGTATTETAIAGLAGTESTVAETAAADETAVEASAPQALPVDIDAAAAALAATPWATTGAVDQNGSDVALDDPRAANFVGNAYFHADGTYTMFNLDDTPKLQGDWEMRIVNGQLARWINAKSTAGDVLWQRIVPIVQLDSGVFTYRVVDAGDPAQWVDIIHTPTDHAEPGSETPGDGDDDGTAESDDANGAGGAPAEGAGETPGETPAEAPTAPAANAGAKQPGALAVTGGAGQGLALGGALLALLSGAAMFVVRAVRRRAI
ncbi:DUF4822 domain-containing protein [Leucobacter sp. gxy201]|uniref:DUF4822 domain-containing protein n=1 Tax=Leucobacter sp. gxy201 TaxID=2957200 RepID=UPI003DA12579